MNTEKKIPDRRVIKTKKAIRNAFAKLLSEKNLAEITIKEISDLADINRKTFYNYYSGIYQLVDEIENELVDSFKNTLNSLDFTIAIKKPYIIFERLTDMLSSDLDFYSHLFHSSKSSSLSSKTGQAIKDAAKSSFADQTNLDDKTLDVIIEYCISGMVSVYQKWFDSKQQMSTQEVSNLISVLCFQGLNGFMKN